MNNSLHVGALLSLLACNSAYAWLWAASFSVRVMDEDGVPVTNAAITAAFYTSRPAWQGPGEIVYKRLTATTADNGECSFKGKCSGRAGYGFKKEGYYEHGESVAFERLEKNKYVPWNKLHEIRVRKIINPIPMYARKLEAMRFPVPKLNATLGYDLVVGDWVPPCGAGITADFLFRIDCEYGGVTKAGYREYDSLLTLSFSNERDGIQEVRLQADRDGSVFKLPRYAPDDGYASNLLWKSFLHGEEGSFPFNEDQNFIFRVRTQMDGVGRITNALYGKIRGPLRYEVRETGACMQFKYYLNPNPNDRNLEYDTMNNLFTNLNVYEQVWEP